MIVVMEEGATEHQIQTVIDRMIDLDFTVHRSTGQSLTVIGGVGPEDRVDPVDLEGLAGVKVCHRIESPYKLAHRHFRPEGGVIRVGKAEIGSTAIALAAGPSLIENRRQIERVAGIVAEAGGQILRGRCDPVRPGFAEPEPIEPALEMLRLAADAHGLGVLAEACDPAQTPLIAQFADIIQVSSQNMQNFRLLGAVRAAGKPVLLRRGVSATLEELLISAEFVLTAGNYDVMVCECGIRTFESHTANTMDIGAIPTLRKWSHLPVLADPSRGSGRRDKVIPMALAAAAAGAHGLLIELHPDPDHARADGGQALSPAQFLELAARLRQLAPAVGRTFG
ncbi:MAG: N-acetylneuraminate synthase family protein [Bryobacteraceae bacterium]